MGLIDAHYKFQGPAPSYEQIYQQVCEMEGREVPSTIYRDEWRLREDDETRRSFSSGNVNGGDTLISSTGMSLYESRLYMDVTLFLFREDKLLLMGNSHNLLNALHKAIESLGGTKQ